MSLHDLARCAAPIQTGRTGAIVLGAGGSAMHRITYLGPGVSEGHTYQQTGTCTVQGDSVVLAGVDSASHPATEAAPKPSIRHSEAESFVYLTGLFIRLAISPGGA